MGGQDDETRDSRVTRRDFLRGATAAGAGLMWAPHAAGAAKRPGGDTLNLALIGCGSQGRTLLRHCLREVESPFRFRALCDIWKYHQKYSSGMLEAYNQEANVYTDYREMLAREKDLDAVVIATPDWVHAEQTIACLQAGLHVYCECEMSRTLEEARAMVETARQTGKLLQIGRQRRSNPRYLKAEGMVCENDALGRITRVRGQWHRAPLHARGWPKDYTMDGAKLKEYGYDTMERLRNWRWCRKFCAGPMAYPGSHQVDVFNWWLGSTPRSVQAKATADYYPDREWWEGVAAIYEYETAEGTVIATYEVANTTSFGGHYEVVMGDKRALKISEGQGLAELYLESGLPHSPRLEPEEAAGEETSEKIGAVPQGVLIAGPSPPNPIGYRSVFSARWSAVYGDSEAPCVNSRLREVCRQYGLELPENARIIEGEKAAWQISYPGWPTSKERRPFLIWKAPAGRLRAEFEYEFYVLLFYINESISRVDWATDMDRSPCTYHLENFFDAIRGKTELTCPGETALATAATVFRTNQAAELERQVTLSPDDFRI